MALTFFLNIFFLKKKKTNFSMFIFISFRLKLNSKNRQSFSVALSLAVATNTISPTRWTAGTLLEKIKREQKSPENHAEGGAAGLGPHFCRGVARSQASPRPSCVSWRAAHTLVPASPVYLTMYLPQENLGPLSPPTPL